eukprot:239731-Rhodomonas_salina.2
MPVLSGITDPQCASSAYDQCRMRMISVTHLSHTKCSRRRVCSASVSRCVNSVTQVTLCWLSGRRCLLQSEAVPAY